MHRPHIAETLLAADLRRIRVWLAPMTMRLASLAQCADGPDLAQPPPRKPCRFPSDNAERLQTYVPCLRRRSKANRISRSRRLHPASSQPIRTAPVPARWRLTAMPGLVKSELRRFPANRLAFPYLHADGVGLARCVRFQQRRHRQDMGRVTISTATPEHPKPEPLPPANPQQPLISDNRQSPSPASGIS